MEKTPVLDRPQIKIENLKWGAADINMGYSFDQAIRLVEDFKKISATTVKIFLGMTPSSMGIFLPRERQAFHDFPFKNHLFITDNNPEQVTHAKGEKNGFLPHGYLVAIKKDVREKSVSPTYTISIYAEEDGKREFRFTVGKILGEYPQDWTFWEHKKVAPQISPTENIVR